MEYTLQEHQKRISNKISDGHSVLAYHSLGSGKTLESLDSARKIIENNPGKRALFIVPAPLRDNLHKEMEKHNIPENIRKSIDVDSYEGATNRAKDLKGRGYHLVVLDEAHRLRNTGIRSNAVRDIASSAKQRLLLTGTPIYNHRSDVAKIINTTAGSEVMPEDPNKFDDKFIHREKITPNLLLRTMGVKTGDKLSVRNQKLLRQLGKKYMDHYNALESNKTDFPDRIDELVHVDMSKDQMRAYKYAEGKLPLPLRIKIRMNLPLDKKEAKDLNAFSSGIRQISNTNKGFTTGKASSPKIDRIVNDFDDMLKDNPNHKGIIYSNYLSSGLEDTYHQLKERNIPVALFTGNTTQKERKDAIKGYNEGKIKAILISSAGSEGLDLKGTRSFQGMEPHFNNKKIEQVIGRGIRYKSHSDLPEEERKVKVMRYLSRKPGGLLSKPSQGIDDYLHRMSSDKDELTKDILKAMHG